MLAGPMRTWAGKGGGSVPKNSGRPENPFGNQTTSWWKPSRISKGDKHETAEKEQASRRIDCRRPSGGDPAGHSGCGRTAELAERPLGGAATGGVAVSHSRL